MADSEDISIVGELDRLASRQPFIPFSIVMASGREYDITPDVSVSTGNYAVWLLVRNGANFVLQGSQISEIVLDREPS